MLKWTETQTFATVKTCTGYFSRTRLAVRAEDAHQRHHAETETETLDEDPRDGTAHLVQLTRFVRC